MECYGQLELEQSKEVPTLLLHLQSPSRCWQHLPEALRTDLFRTNRATMINSLGLKVISRELEVIPSPNSSLQSHSFPTKD